MNECEHKNTFCDELIGLTHFEMCLKCGMSRSITGIDDSPWMENTLAGITFIIQLQSQLTAAEAKLATWQAVTNANKELCGERDKLQAQLHTSEQAVAKMRKLCEYQRTVICSSCVQSPDDSEICVTCEHKALTDSKEDNSPCIHTYHLTCKNCGEICPKDKIIGTDSKEEGGKKSHEECWCYNCNVNIKGQPDEGPDCGCEFASPDPKYFDCQKCPKRTFCDIALNPEDYDVPELPKIKE